MNLGGKRKTPKKVPMKKEDLKKNLMKKKVMVWSGQILRLIRWLQFEDSWMQIFPKVPEKGMF